jgi:hypothetical protein
MSGLFGTLMQANRAAFQTWRRVFQDPSAVYTENQFRHRNSIYNLLLAYYSNSMFDVFNPQVWEPYKRAYNLPRTTRSIYNPTERLVSFYAGNIYPGVLSEDGKSLPEGVQLAIPFSEDTDPALKDAVAQFWQWNNWQARKDVVVIYGASLGNVFVEIIDDLDSGKICIDIPWPGFVYDLSLNSAGNVKAYALEYYVVDVTDKYNIEQYMYRKEVDGDVFRYYKNDQPFDYSGYGAVIENPYGFAPAVWIKHQDLGTNHGTPAIGGAMGKIDELNGLASVAHDQVRRVVGAPFVMWADGMIANLFNKPKRGSTAETQLENPMSDQENLLMLKGPAGGRVDTLAGNLSLGDVIPLMEHLMDEIEKDHPELTYYDRMREMSTVTGPAASRLVGDVQSRVMRAQAIYDQGMIKIFQMACAIGGMRANSGAWGSLTSQQAKFKPFSLDSYKRGDLDMAIMPRPLLTPTKTEEAQEDLFFWQSVQAAVQAGVPVEVVLRNKGWTEEQIAQLGQSQVESIQRKQMLASQDFIPATHL